MAMSADMNGDGNIDFEEFMAIVRKSNGLSTDFTTPSN